jgi:hypothetical protein
MPMFSSTSICTALLSASNSYSRREQLQDTLCILVLVSSVHAGCFEEERPLFWEVITSVILGKKKYICTCILFRTVPEIELFHCTVPKLLIMKTQLRGLSPQAKYTDPATAACRRS